MESSTLPLHVNNHKWAEFRKTKAGIKLHLRLLYVEKGCSYPDKAVLTNAKAAWSWSTRSLRRRQSMYVRFWPWLLGLWTIWPDDERRLFLCFTLAKNAVIRVLEPFELPEESTVVSDEMILIGTSQNRAENGFCLIKVLDSKGYELQFITNRFDLSADEIADLYKSRWAIELFFKWLKQHLNIKKFYAQSEQGVHNQVYIAMIVYCLHVLAQLNTNSSQTYLKISRLLKAAPWKAAHLWLRKITGKAVP